MFAASYFAPFYRMKRQARKDPNDYVIEMEARQITRLGRTQLWRYRMDGTLAWVQGRARRIRYYKPDLYKLIGLD